MEWGIILKIFWGFIMENKDFECCPPFNHEAWQDKTLFWKNKMFIKAKVFTLFYMPINFGSVIKQLDKKIRRVNGEVNDWLCLSDHTSMFNMDIYLAVDKNIPGAENVTLSGNFYSRVYEGDFKNTKQWCEDFSLKVKEKGKKLKKMYMWYTTCPKCAKKYGKNYVAIVGELE